MKSEKPKELYEAPTVQDIDPVTINVAVGVGASDPEFEADEG